MEGLAHLHSTIVQLVNIMCCFDYFKIYQLHYVAYKTTGSQQTMNLRSQLKPHNNA